MAGEPGDIYAIGDLQGCLDCLESLLEQLPGDATLWLTGDLVNRGPQSLATLRWAYRNRDRLVTVLGNHDLHLLAVACGIRPLHHSDTLSDILQAPDRDALLDWLRCQPLAWFASGHLLVHAGVLPVWDVDRVVQLAGEVQARLAGDDWVTFMRTMYGNQPDQWQDDLQGNDRLRVIVNALTRLRFCTAAGRMDLATKDGPGRAPPGYLPWFDAPGRRTDAVTVVFGHWSTLGLVDRAGLLGLDTGCVWGGQLTAVRLRDRARFQVTCPQAARPG